MNAATFTISNDTFRIIEVSNCQDTPAFREALLSSGRDGNVYTAERVLIGRQRNNYTALFVRNTNGNFDTLL
jgi:hypothetical protein